MFRAMWDWLKHFFDWSKVPSYYFLALTIASGFGLFAPHHLLESLGLTFWREEGKFYSGTAFLLSASVASCAYGAILVQWLTKQYHMLSSQWAAQRRLKSLTPKEQELLSGYLKENTRTQELRIEDGIVAGLAHANIIYAAVSQADRYAFPFNIRPWIWDYLKKNPHLVGIESEVKHKSKP